MKKMIFIIGLFLVLSGFKSAQEDRTYSFRSSGYFWNSLICDGVEVDQVEGYLDMHYIVKVENGLWKWWMLNSMKGTLTSKNGEVFKVSEHDMIWKPICYPIHTFHYNLRGDKGSHYVGTGIFNWDTGETIYEKAICPGN